MDASTAARLRKRFWFVFIVLFVLWYLLLYVVDWSALPGRTSTAENFQSEAIQSHPADPLDATTEIPSSHGQDNVSVHEETPPPEKKGDLVPDLDGLEKELEPLLKQNNGKSSCSGRYVYMHDLPARFNDDLIKQCKLLDPWVDMCAYTANQGLGMEVGNPGKIVQARDWFYTHQFSLEPIFHARMKQYDCLTNDSYKAAAVFVPYYAGFDVARYLWADFNASVLDSGARDLVNWLRERPEWKVMWGKDHFFIAGRVTWDFRRLGTTWGNSLLVMPESENMSALTIESSPWDKNDFAIPYPTDYHPSSDEEVAQWQSKMRKQRRGTLFSFAGAERPSMQDPIRSQVMKQCVQSRRKCKLLECKSEDKNCEKATDVIKLFQRSIFCLQPPGDTFTRRSIFDSILAGCIPVLFNPASFYVQYIWHLPKDFTNYSVLIPEDDVKENKVSIERVLARIPRRRVAAMREQVIRLIPKVIYANPRGRLKRVEDAFDLAVKGVIGRVERLRNKEEKEFDEQKSWKYYTFGTVEKHEWDHYFRRRNLTAR
ncbi:probable xyloglucan galactosyltransferase GT11 [Ipomoea triloba]|uniref:probable xyloglucan galactosyltransferase GT11 n=1 Tax=Ipomoea triloba TaxID=35885 RepID=UPI00125DB0A8|nr:probable xyloglucan galactosyltransferase GT11 [Ipomoea triloba]